MSSVSVSEGTQIASGSYTGKMDAMSTIGCFATPTPLVDHGSYTFQSSGNCQKVCYALNMPVMGMTSGTNCSCGELLPPADSKVNSDYCGTACVGYPESCGGAGYWWVLLSGVSHNSIANLDPSSMSSSSSSAAQASVVTVGGGTTIVSTLDPNATDSQHANKSSGGSSNTVGIAVGVVVGIVVLGAIIGGVLFFLRRRQRNLAQQDYEQKQQVQQFVAGGKGYNSNSQTSMGDSRLDPEVMMSRRQSDGSIMDNADYSRRILKVTN